MREMTDGNASAGGAADATLAAAEIARFATLADRWWDPAGPMAPLHAMNPARIGWIRAGIADRFGASARPDLLDVGCGAGLAAEAFARAGHDVLGLDAGEAVIAAAERHAAGQDLSLRYRAGTLASLIAESAQFDAITAFEVIEHVPEPRGFLAELASLLAPGGVLVLSTLNRTRRSLVLGKFAAEYLLGWVPPGTHEWRRFLTPAEIEDGLGAVGLGLFDLAGMSFDPLRRRFYASSDVAINYLLAAFKPGPGISPSP